MAEGTRPVLMAVIGAPHGVKGEVRVKSFTADPLALGAYGPLVDADGRRFTVRSARPAKTMIVVRFNEIGSREAAEAVTNRELFIDRSALPDELDEDEYYQADLVGLAVRDVAGATIGKVVAVHDFGAGEMLELRLDIGGGAMVPFTRAAVPTVSLVGGHVVVDPEAAGLSGDDGEPPS